MFKQVTFEENNLLRGKRVGDGVGVGSVIGSVKKEIRPNGELDL